MDFLNGLKNLIPRRKQIVKKPQEKHVDLQIQPENSALTSETQDKTRVFSPIRADECQLDNQLCCTCKGKISYTNSAGSVLLRELSSGRVNIGRIYENEIYLRDAKVSRLHAFIVYENKAHVLYDAQSTNGTFVNGKKVTNHRLADGDQIKIGNTTLTYQQERLV